MLEQRLSKSPFHLSMLGGAVVFKARAQLPMRHRSTALVASLLLLLAVDVWGLRFYVDPDPAKGDDRRSAGVAQNPDTPFRTITRALKIAHLVPEGRPHVIEIAGEKVARHTRSGIRDIS